MELKEELQERDLVLLRDQRDPQNPRESPREVVQVVPKELVEPEEVDQEVPPLHPQLMLLKLPLLVQLESLVLSHLLPEDQQRNQLLVEKERLVVLPVLVALENLLPVEEEEEPVVLEDNELSPREILYLTMCELLFY